MSKQELDGGQQPIQIRSHNVQTSTGGVINYFIYHVNDKCFWFFGGRPEDRFRQFHFQHIPFYYNGFDGAEFSFLDFQFYSDDVVSMLLKCTVPGEGVRIYFLQLAISSLLAERRNFYEVMDPNCLKLVDGNEWRFLAVSGNRKVCSFLSENRKKVCVFETEAEDDDDEEMDNSNNLDVSK